MANVTFSSPRMQRDVTVYAVAGDTHTLLSVAKQHKVPLNFECENGECGSCFLKVTVLSGKTPERVLVLTGPPAVGKPFHFASLARGVEAA